MNELDSERPRRRDLPKELHERERLLRKAMRRLERIFPERTGILILAFDFGPKGTLSHISNAQREDMIKVLRWHADHLEMRTDDTAGRGEA
ncbi:MAG TPA: hypothetical protein ENK57_12050 [Polyangiaceae bacterium]|nr:hypothetical protein [Polyangiaceae bacterium]